MISIQKDYGVKKKILIVNVYYPPQDWGGATHVVRDNVKELCMNYKDEFDIEILTTNYGGFEDLNYEYDNVNHYSFHSSKFIQSTFTKEGERFIKMNPPHTMMQQKLKDILTGFFGMRHVDAASLLQINKMFVLDSITLLNLLKIQDDDETTLSTVNNN